MNAQILRRSLISVGMAAIVNASLYVATGISGAASNPQSPSAGAVRTMPVKWSITNKAGKTIRRGTGVAKIVRLGSAASAGAVEPSAVFGPSPYCYAHFGINSSVGSGGTFSEIITFPSNPFVVDYAFNEVTSAIYAEVTEQQSSGSNVVTVTALNNGPSTETFNGQLGALYANGGC